MSPERARFLSEGEKSEGRMGVDFPRRGKLTCFEPPARAFRFASGWPSPPTPFALVLKSGTRAAPPIEVFSHHANGMLTFIFLALELWNEKL